MPEVASRHHLELVDAGRRRRRSREAGVDARRRRARSRSPPGPGLIGALLVGVSTRQGARRRARPAADRRSTTCRATSPRTSSSPDPFEPPFLCLVASGGHTLLADVTRPRRLRGARPDARRRRRRGVRQGRAAARPRRSPAARALERLAAGGDPAAFAFPRARRRPRPRLQLRGLKTALLYTVRDLGEEEADAPPRRPRRVLPGGDRRRARRRASTRALEQTGAATGSRSAAASRPTARCASGCAALGGRRLHVPPRARCAPTTRR